jgi:hypothetical protein
MMTRASKPLRVYSELSPTVFISPAGNLMPSPAQLLAIGMEYSLYDLFIWSYNAFNSSLLLTLSGNSRPQAHRILSPIHSRDIGAQINPLTV